MTTGASAPDRPAHDASMRSPGRRAWHRGRSLLAWGSVMAVGVVLVSVLAASQARPDRALDPAGTGPSGSRGLVTVLRQQGISVVVARSAREMTGLPVDGSTSVLVAGGGSISPGTLARVVEHARAGARIVLADPTATQVARLGLPVDVLLGGGDTPVTAGCTTDAIDPGDSISGGSSRFLVDSTAAPPSSTPPTACFREPPPDTASSAGSASGSSTVPSSRSSTVSWAASSSGRTVAATGQRAAYLVDVPATVSRPDTVLLGAPEILTNGTILEQDDARVALRLLGGTTRLVWYLPSAADLSGQTAGGESGTPRWFSPLLLSLATSTVVLALWRGRRLGRVVTEPLPVIVPASETIRSRGRLYHAARDRGRTAEILRDATRRRLATRLGLPRHPAPEDLVHAVVAASGIPAQDVHAILWGETPRDDAGVVDVAAELDQLEERVRGV